MALEQLAHQSLDRRGAAPTLNPDIQHGAVLTYGSPEPVLHAADRHHHLVKVAFVLRIGAAPGSAGRSTDQTWWRGIVPSRRSDQGPGYQHFLHHAQPERKSANQDAARGHGRSCARPAIKPLLQHPDNTRCYAHAAS